FQAEDGIRDRNVTGVQTCALPISTRTAAPSSRSIATADRYDSFPVRGFSEGTFSISIRSLPNSPSIVMRCWFTAWPGTAKILIQIGRASCRERVEVWGVGVGWKDK